MVPHEPSRSLEFSACAVDEHRYQLSLGDFFLPFGGELFGGTRWGKIAELIPLDELEDDYTV